MKQTFLKTTILSVAVFIFSFCTQSNNNRNENQTDDSSSLSLNDTPSAGINVQDTTAAEPAKDQQDNSADAFVEFPVVKIYNFHVTNRCASCIAIEEATTKTLTLYFSAEVKQGRIKREIVNVDEEANKNISEKYEAFGSGLFITRVFNGKETTTDLTGDGFKFARNKEERFIEILKNKISEYLK